MEDERDVPQEEQTVGELYKEDFERTDDHAFGEEAEEGSDDGSVEGQEESGDEPGDEPEEDPGESVHAEELTPLDDEEPESEAPTITESALKARLAREKAKHEREIERLRAGNQSETPYSPESIPMPASELKPPSEDDFEDRDDYLVAKAAFKAKQDLLKDQAEARAAEQKRRQEAAQKELVDSYSSKVDAEIAKDPERYKDFEDKEAFVTTVGFHPMALHSLMTAESPAPIVKYLANKPAEALRIAKLSPLQQVEEIGYLKRRSQVKPTQKRVSKAPEPIKTERGNSSSPQRVKFASDMSEKDYDKLVASKGGSSARVGDLMK